MLQRFRAAPLSASFSMIGILGFIATLFLWDKFDGQVFDESFAFTLTIFFLILFIASMISMQRAPLKDPEVIEYMTRVRSHVSKPIPRKKQIKRKVRKEVKQAVKKRAKKQKKQSKKK